MPALPEQPRAAAETRTDAVRDHRLVDLQEGSGALPCREIDADPERGLAHLVLSRRALRLIPGALLDVENRQVEVGAEGCGLVVGVYGAAKNRILGHCTFTPPPGPGRRARVLRQR